MIDCTQFLTGLTALGMAVLLGAPATAATDDPPTGRPRDRGGCTSR